VAARGELAQEFCTAPTMTKTASVSKGTQRKRQFMLPSGFQ